MMISIVRLLLLSQLWCISPVLSSGGLLRGGGGRDLIEEGEDVSPFWGNSTVTDTVDNVDINHLNRAADQSDEMEGVSPEWGNSTDTVAVPFDEIEQRIVGGSYAGASRNTYTVAIIADTGYRFKCGGVLIAKDMVLTAAHCFHPNEAFLFVIGSQSVSYGLAGRTGELLYSEKFWINPDYSVAKMENDFMVYKLVQPVMTYAEVVTVNNDASVPSGGQLVALGWGDTARTGSYRAVDSLRKVGVGYIPNDSCKKRTGYLGNAFISYQNKIRDNMICALDYGKDSCQGDSGGPLVIEGNDQRGRNDVLVGLSSWGVACAHRTLPGVYSRVSYKYKWIRAVVCQNSRDPPASFNCNGKIDKNTNGNKDDANDEKHNSDSGNEGDKNNGSNDDSKKTFSWNN